MTTKRLCFFLLCLVAAAAKHPLPVLATSKMPDNVPDEVPETEVEPDENVEEDTLPPPHLQSKPLLQVPCSLQLLPESKRTSISTFVDTGAQVSVLSVEAAARAGVMQMMDRRYAGHAQGVGQCRVLGRLPAGVLLLHMHGEGPMEAPAITILEHTNDGVDLLLGLDFLRDRGAILNLRTEEMTIQLPGSDKVKREVSIPFIRPRAKLDFGGEGIYQPSRLCASDIDSDEESEEEEDPQNRIDMSGV
jgi:hypothetical protein